jgi:hypothetical protein
MPNAAGLNASNATGNRAVDGKRTRELANEGVNDAVIQGPRSATGRRRDQHPDPPSDRRRRRLGHRREPRQTNVIDGNRTQRGRQGNRNELKGGSYRPAPTKGQQSGPVLLLLMPSPTAPLSLMNGFQSRVRQQ